MAYQFDFAPVLAQGGEAVLAAGEQLVGVRLVAHIPDDRVSRTIELRVERHGEFNDSQARAEMTAVPGDRIYDLGPHLIGDTLERHAVQLAQRAG